LIMKTLAFVTYTITAPADLAGTEFITNELVECIPNMEATVPALEANGAEIDAFCDYTFAPITSMRPVARPERTKQ